MGVPGSERRSAPAPNCAASEPPNFGSEAQWYRLAADKDSADAQAALGEAYADGRGVTQDAVNAHKWLTVAAAAFGRGGLAGNTSCWSDYRRLTQRLNEIAATMSSDQLSEARRRVREWKNMDHSERATVAAREASSPSREKVKEFVNAAMESIVESLNRRQKERNTDPAIDEFLRKFTALMDTTVGGSPAVTPDDRSDPTGTADEAEGDPPKKPT